MGFIENNKLAVCLSFATILGACGDDASEEVRDDEDESSEESSAVGTGSNPASGGNSASGSSNGSDAGADAPATDAAAPVIESDASRPPSGETWFEFLLTREQEVPACSAGSAQAIGAARLVAPDDGESIQVLVALKGLSGSPTLAHIHAGAPGVAGPVVLNFGKPPFPAQFTKKFTAADYPSPAPAGAPATFDAFVESLREGNAYVNVHTQACGTGEIRGQVGNHE